MPEITAAGSSAQAERVRIRRQEKQAFLGMKLVETICCLICAGLHIQGFLHYPEPFPHEMLFCGLYASYFLISFYSFVFLYKDCCALNYAVEAVVSGGAFLLFVVSAFVSMYHAEKDIHLQYLTDEEEWYHQFFIYCRLQSLGATITAQMFLVHCSLALDLAGLLDRWFGGLGGASARTSAVEEGLTVDAEACGRLQINPFWMPAVNEIRKRLPCDCAKPAASG
uniref:DUF7775 domain-containing protein n=1 Tax=Anopheles dirus TaxID=7168 RepID=A0A182N1Z6_9DIPT